jgi:hypothetical protein
MLYRCYYIDNNEIETLKKIGLFYIARDCGYIEYFQGKAAIDTRILFKHKIKLPILLKLLKHKKNFSDVERKVVCETLESYNIKNLNVDYIFNNFVDK